MLTSSSKLEAFAKFSPYVYKMFIWGMLQIICLHLSGSSKRWITNSQPLGCTCRTWFHLLPHSEFSRSVQFSDRVNITILHSKQGWWFYDFEVWWFVYIKFCKISVKKTGCPNFIVLWGPGSPGLTDCLTISALILDLPIHLSPLCFASGYHVIHKLGRSTRMCFLTPDEKNRIVMNHRWNTRCLPTTCECRACWIALPTCPGPQMLQIRITCQPCKNVFTYDFYMTFIWLCLTLIHMT